MNEAGEKGKQKNMKTAILNRINFPFLLLIATAFCLMSPFAEDTVIFLHDTMNLFHNFYYFYNEFYLNGEFARWLPFGYYGMPSYLPQTVISPMMYWVMIGGRLTGATNILALFKIAVLLEHLILLTGSYLLASRFFRYRTAVFFTCLGILAASVWQYQIYINFRCVYLIPLALFFLHRFLVEGKAVDFWISGLVFLSSLAGVAAYYAPLFFVIAVIFSAVMTMRAGKPWKALLSPRTGNRLGALCLLAAAGILAGYVFHALRGVETFFTGRDAATQATSVSDFVSYGGGIGLTKFVYLFLASNGNADYTLYVGLLPLVFLLYGIRNCRKAEFSAMGVLLFFFAAFSLADTSFLARTSYHSVPVMKYFRHIGLVGAFIRLFLLFCAGFGLDCFLSDLASSAEGERGNAGRWKKIVYTVFLLAAFGVMSNALRGIPRIPQEICYGAVLVLGIMAVAVSGRPRGHGSEEREDRFSPERSLLFCGGLVFVGALMLDRLLQDRGVDPRTLRPEFFYYCLVVLAFAVLFLSGRRMTAVTSAGVACIFFFAMDILSYQNLITLQTRKTPEVREDVIHVHSYAFPDERRPFPLPGTREAAAMNLYDSGSDYTVRYGFAQFDPCMSTAGTGVLSEGVSRFAALRGVDLLAREMPPVQGKPDVGFFLRAMGCGAPKMKLAPSVLFARSREQAEEYVKRVEPVDRVILLEGVPEQQQQPWEKPETDLRSGSVSVTRFRANSIEARVENDTASDTWLYYADSWHPGWKAAVDGKGVPVFRANLGFKAIRVPSGPHDIRFDFRDTPGRFLQFAWMIFALLAGAGMLVLLGRTCCLPREETRLHFNLKEGE